MNKYRIMFLLSCFWAISFYGCSSDKKDEISKKVPQIILSADRIEAGKELSLNIGDLSLENIKSINWDFGDGKRSEDLHPLHTYIAPGNYVILAAVTCTDGDVVMCKGNVEVYLPAVENRASIPVSLQDKEHIQICAHRGYWKDAPENSIKAIELAIENKIDIIELDVRMSKDEKLLLMHDASIDRTANGKGKVANLSYQSLSAYRLYHNLELTTERIPLLAEALLAARGKIYIDLDVKITNYKLVYEMVKLYGMLSQVMFTVYEPRVAQELAKIDKNIIMLPVIYSMEDLDSYLSVDSPLCVAQFNTKAFTNEILKKAFANGIAAFKNIYINSDVTPNSDSYKQVDSFVAKKGNVIQTDFPLELKEYLNFKLEK